MLVQVAIASERDFDFGRFLDLLGMDDIVLSVSPDDVPNAWGFYRGKHSVSMFTIERIGTGYILSMDRIASYEDYRFFPYLVDTLSMYLTDSPYSEEDDGAFQIFDEEWVAESIGEEIAYMKCVLSLGLKYYLTLPIDETFVYVSDDVLNSMGVTIYSSTPRIYGYVIYMLRHDLLPSDEIIDETMCTDDEIQVDVPQHVSIGTVLSWQTDGSETTESYCKEDVDLLLTIAERYERGEEIEGVVLNDIGTIYEYGIGLERNPDEAIRWYKEAIRRGDLLYAPTSLGDIYRRGLGHVKSNLTLALEAYMKSEDPYAWYRIGQSFEEGWTTEPDIDKAMQFYRKAAAVGHHLALKRLECEEE
jgi:hypothetical protein